MPIASPDKRDFKVLLVTPDYPPTLGGIQRLLFNITRSMQDVETRVLTVEAPGAREFDSASIQKTQRVRVPGKRAAVRNACFNLLAVLRADNWRPDVVLNGHVVSSPAAALLGRRFRVPTVLYTYGKEIDGRPRMAAWALRRSKAAVAVSDYTRSRLLTAARSQPSPPVHVITPGVELPPSASQPRAEQPTILTVARLRDRYKGHDVMLAALPKVLESVPNVRWIVVGDGKIRGELESMAARLGISNAVSFVGAIDDAKKDALFASSHVFAMPSRYPRGEVGGEGFPVVYLEAAAWGLPAIAGNVGGPAEAVIHEQTGLLVDPEDPSQIADALVRLLKDPEFASALGENARRRVEHQFTWASVAAELSGLLHSIAEGEPDGRR